jgi:hypothetical protein
MYQEGQMTEYGWFDRDVELSLAILIITHNISRWDALILYFNNQ